VASIDSEKKGSDSSKLIAYGLGDFCIWEELKDYLYGMVIKVDIGPIFSRKMANGSSRMAFYYMPGKKCHRLGNGNY